MRSKRDSREARKKEMDGGWKEQGRRGRKEDDTGR